MQTMPQRSCAETAACTSSLLDDLLQRRQKSLHIRRIVVEVRRHANVAAADTHINAGALQSVRDDLAAHARQADADQVTDALALGQYFAAELARADLEHASEWSQRALNTPHAPLQNLLEPGDGHGQAGKM